jgi:anti-anti-sigma regulatory factor
MLRITIQDAPPVMTLQLEGQLAGPWVRVLEESWQSALARRPVPVLHVDLTGLTYMSATGRACLASLRCQGAEFVAADDLTNAVVAEINQTPAPDCRRQKRRS